MNNHGGYREKAGRKTSWVSGCKFEQTKLIRVPESLSIQLLEIAHKLDEGQNIQIVTKSRLENEQIERAKEIVLKTRRQDKAVVRRSLAELLNVDVELLK